MDLSFARLDREITPAMLPATLAVLMAGVAARQAASFTARIQAALAPVAVHGLLAPANGAFNAATAANLMRWQEE